MTTQNLNKPAIFSRRQYVREQIVSHADYYAQFVTKDTMLAVENAFSVDRLRTALEEDPHLNTIPLRQWDGVSFVELDDAYPRRIGAPRGRFRARLPFDREAAAAANEGVTRSTLVCIAKCAARMLVEQHVQQPVAQAA